MKCMDCPLKYVGQTGRKFNTRYKEHIHDIRTNNSNTGFANHILNTVHTYRTITDTMEIMKTERKGSYLNTFERYYIYENSKDNLHMNDTNIDIHNPIFKALHRIYTKQFYIPPLLPPTIPPTPKLPPNSINTKQAPYKRLNVHHTTRNTNTRKENRNSRGK
jgi:hypothetical protein